MRIHKTIAIGLLGLAAMGSSLAQQNACPSTCGGSGNTMSGSQIANLLGNKVVCAVLGNEVWQEVHAGSTGGTLSDLKGQATAQEVVGQWLVTTNGTAPVVRYNYGTGGTYDYIVCAQNQNATTVHFCGSGLGGRNITGATIKTSGPC